MRPSERNVYIRAFHQHRLYEKVTGLKNPEPMYFFGEVFGYKVQDLQYGYKANELGYRIFDIAMGKGNYVNSGDLDMFCRVFNLTQVPVLYQGPYSKEKIAELTIGHETVSGQEVHMREGEVGRH